MEGIKMHAVVVNVTITDAEGSEVMLREHFGAHAQLSFHRIDCALRMLRRQVDRRAGLNFNRKIEHR